MILDNPLIFIRFFLLHLILESIFNSHCFIIISLVTTLCVIVISNENVLPSPNLLSNSSFPPSILIKLVAIVRPKPVPPCSLILLLSTCVNASNILSLSSWLIPIPVSDIVNLTVILSSFEVAFITDISTYLPFG